MERRVAILYGFMLAHLCLIVGAWRQNVEDFLEGQDDASMWRRAGFEEIEKQTERKQNTNVAKNIIIFIGDGMGVSTVTAARILKGQLKQWPGEEQSLNFERFDNVAIAKTYTLDTMTPDSAATATAMLTGVKTNVLVLGYDGNVNYDECPANQQDGKLDSILKWARDSGRRTGIVTTSHVTHATPAAAYANSPNRDWESDSFVKGDCKDIARQLVEDNNFINVVMGGGRQHFLPTTEPDPVTGWADPGVRTDGRNLIKAWKRDKKNRGQSFGVAYSREDFNALGDVDYVLGLFDSSHMDFDMVRRNEGTGSQPSIAEMVDKAIQVLDNDNGFVLVVEGARIDHAHHYNLPQLSLYDTLAFDDAVKVAKQRTQFRDTLMVVTADHSHGFNLVGYPTRGLDLFGKMDQLALDGKPLTLLQYANGPGFTEPRQNLTDVNTGSPSFMFPAAAPLPIGTHTGEDVEIFAEGPMSHLVNGVQEQTYIAYVMAYSACIGPYGKGRKLKACLKGRKIPFN